MVSDPFEPDPAPAERAPPAPRQLVLDLDGFEGPLDLLLSLARDQKVDITRISILQLAEQYLDFIGRARELQLEVAADYLVMAAWLAYLKSRLLLPRDEVEDEPTGPELAAALTFQLQRLEAMREAGGRLMARPRLGQDFFSRGEAEEVEVARSVVFDVSLFDLLKAYSGQQRRQEFSVLRIEDPVRLYTIEDARERLAEIVGSVPDWRVLVSFLPPGVGEGLSLRSAVASTFVAGLELTKEGTADIRQDRPFGPIYLRGGRGRT